jgi:hypothetical protein
MTVTANKNTIHLNAQGQAYTGPGKLVRIQVYSPAVGALLAQCFDGTSGVGTPAITVPLRSDEIGAEAGGSYVFECGVEFETGLFVKFTGAGEVVCVIER